MKKDDRVSFRISSGLKRDLEEVARKEGRSTAQVVDAFLKAGVENYRKSGSKALQKWLSRDSTPSG